MGDEQENITGGGTNQPVQPSSGDRPVEIDLDQWVGQEGGVDSMRNEWPNAEVEKR